jgi:hypothetical protein
MLDTLFLLCLLYVFLHEQLTGNFHELPPHLCIDQHVQHTTLGAVAQHTAHAGQVQPAACRA